MTEWGLPSLLPSPYNILIIENKLISLSIIICIRAVLPIYVTNSARVSQLYVLNTSTLVSVRASLDDEFENQIELSLERSDVFFLKKASILKLIFTTIRRERNRRMLLQKETISNLIMDVQWRQLFHSII